jgi:hypothetical protein
MTPTEAKRIAGTYGLATTFDPASDCDVLHPPGDTDAGQWITLRQCSESDFHAACKAMSRKTTKKPPEAVAAAPVAKARTETPVKEAIMTDSLYGRLLKFQAAAPAIHKNCSASLGGNRSYKYADLSSCLEAIRPVLSQCGLVMTQTLGAGTLTTAIIDAATGERLESCFPLPLDGLNWHGVGSAISYARRYAVLALLGLTADDDDDAASTLPDRSRAAAATLAEECPDCGGEMKIGPKTGTPYCKACWSAKRNGYAVHN